MSNTTSAYRPMPIKGAYPNLDTPEADELWRGCPHLRPSDHAAWLRHFINLEFNIARLQAGWVPAIGKLEWKLEFPRFMFEDMQRAKRLRERLEEMPRAEDSVTDTEETIARFFAAIAPAEHASTFFGALYGIVKPALAAAYDSYLARCDEILDAPIIYTVRGVVHELRRQIDEARAFMVNVPLMTDDPETADACRRHVGKCLASLGDLTFAYARDAGFQGTPVKNPAGPSPAKTVHDPALHLTGTHEFPADKERNPFASTLQEIIYHNATEWQVVGPMCYVMHDIPVMPLDFYIDFTRHIWDECRHAAMGIRRLRELGYDRDDFHYPNGGDKPTSPEEYLASLTLIGEACSFGRKRGSILPFLRQGDYRSAMLPEVDCNDEKQHVAYGHKWVPEVYFRARNSREPIKQITETVRRAFLDSVERLKEASPEDKQAIMANLPTFCSTIEFAHLDFDANAVRAEKTV